MADPKWKRFEKLIHALHEQLVPKGATVTLDDKIMGSESATLRQIDVSIRVTVSGYPLLIVVECKDWAEPIDLPEIDGFSAKLKDVGANKGVIVSATGFTEGAINAEKSRGIETRRYFDTEGGEWRAEVSIPVLLSGIKPTKWFASFSRVPGHPWRVPIDEPFAKIKVFSEAGEFLGTVRALAARKWNEIGGPSEPGDHRYLIGEDLVIKVHGIDMHTRIDATIQAERHYYFGPLPIQAEGMIDEQAGTMTTGRRVTDFINPGLIEKGEVAGWNEIDNPADLSVRPVFTFLYTDALNEIED
jgi:hypothetical protein